MFAYLADFAVEDFSRSVTGDGTGPRRSHRWKLRFHETEPRNVNP